MIVLPPPAPHEPDPAPITAAAANDLRAAVVAGLERTIWQPPDGISDQDRVEAVQLLGQFQGPAAHAALARVLDQAAARIAPPLGRWLRDTALDTLLRAPAQQSAATAALLRRYYGFGARLRRGRLERNVIYDDIPVLVQHGRGGLILRAYILPLLATCLALAVVPWLLDAALGAQGGGLTILVGLLFFTGLGLALYNLHQVLLVLLLAAAGRRLSLPVLTTWGAKLAAGAVLATLTLALAVAALLIALRNAASFNAGSLQAEAVTLVALPLLTLPCYMVAHDLEAATPHTGPVRQTGVRATAVALHWISGFGYVAFTVAAYAQNALPRLFNESGSPGDWAVLALSLPWWVYLLAAPLPVLLLLGSVGRVQRRPPRSAPTPTPGRA